MATRNILMKWLTASVSEADFGAWLPNSPRKNILVWEENGITYMAISNGLTLEEVLKVAKSLGK
jgi:hypothetical protein